MICRGTTVLVSMSARASSELAPLVVPSEKKFHSATPSSRKPG